MQKIPSRECLIPVNTFLIDGRYLYLYIHPNRPSCANYSLYWEDGENIRHACTDREVFNILSQLQLLEDTGGQKPGVTVQPKGIGGKKVKKRAS